MHTFINILCHSILLNTELNDRRTRINRPQLTFQIPVAVLYDCRGGLEIKA